MKKALLAISLLSLACVGDPNDLTDEEIFGTVEQGIDWGVQDTNGIWVKSDTTGNGSSVKLAKIDLWNGGVSVMVTRPADKSISTLDWYNRVNAQVAINAHYFGKPDGSAWDTAAAYASDYVRGLWISEGNKITGNDDAVFGLKFGKANDGNAMEEFPQSATMGVMGAGADGWADFWGPSTNAAITGNTKLVSNDVANKYSDGTVAERTAVGLSANQQYLYLIVVHGPGMSLSNFATYIKNNQLGVDAINLDGGGSSAFHARNAGKHFDQYRRDKTHLGFTSQCAVSVSGHVKRPDGGDAANATVKFYKWIGRQWQEEVVARTTTGSAGNYEKHGIPCRNLKVTVTHPSFNAPNNTREHIVYPKLNRMEVADFN